MSASQTLKQRARSELGLIEIATSDSAILDIVFVHGLTGNWFETWSKNDIFWPVSFLREDIAQARIFAFGYDADVVSLLHTAGSNTLRDHGKSLAAELGRRRRRTATTHRPIIFVAHSLGGLVTEQSLLISRGASEDYVADLLDSTYAIAFMGTPHAGSDLANRGKILTGLGKLVRRTNSDIVKVLQPGSEMLRNVQEEFHGMLQSRSKAGKDDINIFCFYEEIAVLGVGPIVPDHSAVLARYPSQSIHADHSDMTKFASRNDPGYRAVSDQLWVWADDISKHHAAQSTTSNDVSPEDIRGKRLARFGHGENTGNIDVRGNVSTEGGSVFVGSQAAEGSITNHW